MTRISERDFNDPKYVAWRKAVYKRDGFKCVICKKGGRLNAHHIKRWATYPQLRFALENGATLCWAHHHQTIGREEEFEPMLIKLVPTGKGQGNVILDMLIMRRNDRAHPETERPDPA